MARGSWLVLSSLFLFTIHYSLFTEPARSAEAKNYKKSLRYSKQLYVAGVEREGAVVPFTLEIQDSAGITEITLAVHDPVYEFVPDLQLPFGWQRTSPVGATHDSPLRKIVISTGGRVGGTVSLPLKFRRRKPDLDKEPGGITPKKRSRIVRLPVEEWEARPKELGLFDLEFYVTFKLFDGTQEKHAIDVEIR